MNTPGAIGALITDYLPDGPAIIQAVAAARRLPSSSSNRPEPRYLHIRGLARYQEYLYHRFCEVITTPSFEYISKTARGWLIVGDHRDEIAARVELIVERYGLGVGMLVLHAQQMQAQHILLELPVNGKILDLTRPTARLCGRRGESILSVPIRRYRRDWARLAELNIAKPEGLWDPAALVTHEQVSKACNYCSAAEINPCEVVVSIEGARFGLSRNYRLGFTFAPFGNPLSVVHFLAWHHAPRPLNMNRTPITFSDLVEMTRRINTSIVEFFAGTGVDDYPVIDGVSNGWAGNTIYHQHFQFFRPEHPAPITDRALLGRKPMLERDDIRIHKLDWGTPVYKITAEDAINIGLVGNDMAGIWRLLGGSAMVPYRSFPDGYAVEEGELVPVHTQNLYVTGQEHGRAAYILPRDKRLVDFKPGPDDYVYVNQAAGRLAQPKENIGVLEASGTMIVDDQASFDLMSGWSADDITTEIDLMTAAIQPDRDKIEDFERNVRGLFS